MKWQLMALACVALGGISQPVCAADRELTTRVSGVVAEVLVKSGQRVKKGAVLLRLDPAVLQARVDEATAEHLRAQADEAEAKREFERAKELFDRGVSSTTELDTATLRQTRAEANRTIAAARRTIAQKNLSDAELRAPVDGVVKALPGGVGTLVTAECQPRTLVIFSSSAP